MPRQDILHRLFVIFLLFVVLLAMFIHYGAVASQPGHDRLKESNKKLESYEQHVGDRLYFWGQVVSSSGEDFAVRTSGRRLRVTESEATVREGDAVQVAGVVRPNHVIEAEKVVVSPQLNIQYLYIVSALGAVLTAFLFSQSWSAQWRELQFVPRQE